MHQYLSHVLITQFCCQTSIEVCGECVPSVNVPAMMKHAQRVSAAAWPCAPGVPAVRTVACRACLGAASGPVHDDELQERGKEIYAALASEASYNTFLDSLSYVMRGPPAQLPDLDRIINFCIAEVSPVFPPACCCRQCTVRVQPLKSCQLQHGHSIAFAACAPALCCAALPQTAED